MVQAVQRVLDNVLVFVIDGVAVSKQSKGGTVEGILKIQQFFSIGVYLSALLFRLWTPVKQLNALLQFFCDGVLE